MVGVRKKNLLVVIIYFFSFLIANFSYCNGQSNLENKETTYSREIGLMTGWGSGELKRQDDYNAIPLYLQIGFDLKSFFKKINIKPKGSINFILEPFLSAVISPDSNIEAGTDFLLKYRHPITLKLQIYFEAGLGLMFTSQHTAEQATQFNFTEQLGGGLSYLFLKNKAVNLGYRFRHFSNAGIEEPNAGIDMEYFLCGISVFY